jgi:MFS family permease
MSNLRQLPRTVVVLGAVSFFNDLASEMVTPLIPILLAAVLGAGPLVLGLVEGAAEAVSAFLKLWSGRYSDWLGGRRKWLIFSGYLLSNLVRPLMGLAGNWPQVAALRSIDRVGKGIRAAPRDALVSDATPPAVRGLAYGFHRALDNGGAMGGSLAAAAVLAWTPLTLAQIILVSAIPGALGVLLVAFGVREDGRRLAVHERQPLPTLQWDGLSQAMRRYLAVLALFTFARASETFIVLRGHQMGVGVVELLLMWSALSFAKALSSLRGGWWADRLGHERLVLFGWLSHAAAFALLAFAASGLMLWGAAIVYGLLTGAAEGAERALIGDLAAAGERGTAFGWYNMTLGLAAIPAGLLFGSVWQWQGAPAAFFLASCLACAAAALLHFWAARHIALGRRNS